MNLQTLKSKLSKPGRIPAGWKTRAQWQKKWGVGYFTAITLIFKAVDSKLCRVKKFPIPCINGLHPTNHYKFKNAK